MAVLWVIFILTSSGLHFVHGLPINPSSKIYPQEASGLSVLERWTAEGGLYAALPALALVFAAFGLLFGCTWCYRHKDCKIFTASVTQLHEARRSQPPDSGFSEPQEDNNNGPISLREMQNIANNNAAAYIASESERGRESVVEFEPLPAGIGVLDPLERCADWFAGEDLPRDRLQYLREIGRGWFGRVVKGEIEDGDVTTMVAVKILNQNASLEDKARFLDEARMYRDLSHDHILAFVAKCLQEDPWLLIFELCSMDLQQYITANRAQMERLNESGTPLQLMCDVTSALAHVHARGYVYRNLWSGNVLVRGEASPRAVLGQYAHREPPHELRAPETARHPHRCTTASDVWSLGHVVWELCAWAPLPPPATHLTPPAPPAHAVYGDHLYQVMQLCWNTNHEARPTAAQVHALINHLLTTHAHASTADDGYGSSDFEERWQRLKPNTIPKIDEHVAIVHAPSTSVASHFSSEELSNAPQDSLSIDIDTAVSRSSSIMSDNLHAKSDSLTNLHGSLEDVRNIYLTHNETATLECHQGNIALEESKETDSVDPWLKDIITDSQDDVSYYRDVSDVIKNLDNILNSEKTSSSESSHQASPSRDNLSLECKKESPMQTSMVKSPGISNFKSILEMDFDSKSDAGDCEDDEGDADTIGNLSHSFERHSDTTSQQTLENITPETPVKDLDVLNRLSENETNSETEQKLNMISETESLKENESNANARVECNNYEVPKLKELCVVSMPSISKSIEDINEREDCQKAYASKNISNDNETKSIENKIDLRNGIANPNCDTKAKQVEMKLNGNEEKLNAYIAQDIEKVNNINKAVNETYSDNCVDKEETNEDTECSEILKDFKPNDSLLSEVLANKCISEILQNGATGDTIINDATVLYVSSEKNVTRDPITYTTETLHELNTENLNLDATYKISPSATFIVNEIVENEKCINDNDENTNSNISSTILSDETNSAKQNNLPHEFCNDNVSVDSNVHELIDQKNVTAPVESSNHGNISNDASLNIYDLSQSINEEDLSDEKQSCQKIEENVIHRKEGLNSVDIVSQTSLGVPSNIVINESFNVDENSALGFSESYSKQITKLPETVQILSNSTPLKVYLDDKKEIVEEMSPLFSNMSIKPENQVQSNYSDIEVANPHVADTVSLETDRLSELAPRVVSDTEIFEKSSDSTIYMDLTDNKDTKKVKDNMNNNANALIKPSEAPSITNVTSSSINESTVYLDLPNIVKETNDFLHSEKINYEKQDRSGFEENMLTSTPKESDHSAESTLESVEEETASVTKIAAEGVGDTFTKPKNSSENLSPFESPTKSHPTDTYDENSSVVLGSLENCIFESLKTLKSDLVDLPKEELLAFSSNFSEINLETPSPLRDGNFLNEVPDILSDELQFDGIENIEVKSNDPGTENTTESEELSSTKRVSPSTPPNSPGNFLVSTSQAKYLVDIDINTDSSTGNTIEEVHLNQIDLQMTAKMAMAENENNMNIEYSGPPVEREDAPECYLAGNVGAVDYQREGLAIDEERMKELRNELELKLPLAQVSGIEPAREWSPPPPPELVVLYGALSPIAEETRGQLSAYENDDHWNQSVRTESSESYPEPCNNSTDEATDLPGQSGHHSTYTLRDSVNHTYTVPRELPPCSSKEITMSADSLNSSPLKLKGDVLSPIDDKTYTKAEEEKDSNCERLSQTSPFLISPTTDTSAPDNSELAAGMSTLSKTTVPTDAKFSKPSETQCLSKATSIDSWCSNDTLYNVEENFDDLAMDPDVEYEAEHDRDKSESDDTLAHDDEKENSHCSTYIVHDSKSDACETFSPDSITANDNYTYTKAKTEVVATTPSITKSELNDSNDTKNTQTKDLAYGTLMSGLPSFSNCTTELVSAMDDTWKIPQPELVRKSPINSDINFTPPRLVKEEISEMDSPKFTSEPVLKKMDSVEIFCLKDSVPEAKYESPGSATECFGEAINDSLNRHFRNMGPSVTSTPCLGAPADDEGVEPIPLHLSNNSEDSSELDKNVPNFNVFFQSAEIRPQDISSNINEDRVSKEILLEGDSETISKESNKNGSGKTPTYSDFEFSAVTKPQDVSSKEKFSQSGDSSEEFRQFQNSAVNCPQDLSSLIDASSLLLKSERRFSELASSNLTNIDFDFKNQTESHLNEPESLTVNAPIYTNLVESHNSNNMNVYITDIDDENEQPHSIIVTESPLVAAKLSSNVTHDNVAHLNDIHTFDQNTKPIDVWNNDHSKYLNGPEEIIENIEEPDLKSIDSSSIQQSEQSKQTSAETNSEENNERSNEKKEEPNAVTCNGTNEVYATINIINETFEELVESNVDDNDTTTSETGRDEQVKSDKSDTNEGFQSNSFTEESRAPQSAADINGAHEDKVSATDDFLQNEKKYCQLDSIFPLLSDIRFTGPATEIMSTSFTQDSPTEPNSPEYEQDGKPDINADSLKDWDSDSDSHSTNSSSGEFIWKQRDGGQPSHAEEAPGPSSGGSGSGDSGSGSEGDEVAFVPSSWDCRAAPSKSSLRSLEQPTLTQDTKKRVVFKRQKYHCVYEYPRETIDMELDSPAYLPDFSTYSEWDTRSAAEAEVGYGQLFGAPSPLDVYPLRAGISFGPDYVDDFFISSSARPFESLGVMSSSSQFFPGLHKADLCDEEPPSPLAPLAPPLPSPLPPLLHAKTPSLDFTTPDSGVEDITPGSLADDDYKRKLCEWRGDSASSSESVSPSSPGEALGGLRHTRDKLKLDLPPSPLAPSPRHSRVFSFVLDKPRRPDTDTPHTPPAPDTPQPTFSTFGKAQCRPEPERNIVLTDEPDAAPAEREATVLDSGDEDSGIESSSKATLDGNASTPNVS